MKNVGKLSGILIAAFSLLLVFGALMTALAETGFTTNDSEKTPVTVTEKATATLIQLPTKEKPPTEEPKETEADKLSPTKEKMETKSPTKTDQPAKTAAATDDGSCGKPDGWTKYTVKSGDTLFAISILFQTDVAELKSGNCLTTNQIITGQVLWVPDNATVEPAPTKTPKTTEPTKTPKPTTPTKTPKPTTDSCYLLTLSHLGDGADATATPTNSAGCAAGKYKAGEKISLEAVPAAGWEVGSWYGTDNDSSTALTNTVTMPAKDHLAKPIYEQTCYALTISSGANGEDPVPDKAKSSGCNTGKYLAGETITFTANPDTGYEVDSWTGTDSGTNVLTMPTSTASVSVSYSAISCYTMTLGVASGSGSVPTASASSMGCSAGEYADGEVVTVTAAPSGGGIAQSWAVSSPATYSKTSDPLKIEVTMGAGACTVDVTYNP